MKLIFGTSCMLSVRNCHTVLVVADLLSLSARFCALRLLVQLNLNQCGGVRYERWAQKNHDQHTHNVVHVSVGTWEACGMDIPRSPELVRLS